MNAQEKAMNAEQTTSQLDALANTHEVFNQATPLQDYNAFRGDTALYDAVLREGGERGVEELDRYGFETTRPEVIEWGYQANANKPEFETHDRYGHRVDQVNYHPAYHKLMDMATREGLHSSPWTDPGPGAQVLRAAKYYMHAQVEGGHGCPITMTFASVPSLRLTPSLAEQWLPKVTARGYDGRNVSHHDKQALTIGMGMTEKQGGSDVRANTTRAHPVGAGGSGALYELGGPQVVHVRADVRRLPDAGPVARRLELLSGAALARGRQQEPAAGAAPQEQDGQCLQRLPPRWSCAAPTAGWSGKRVAACRRSSKWWR